MTLNTDKSNIYQAKRGFPHETLCVENRSIKTPLLPRICRYVTMGDIEKFITFSGIPYMSDPLALLTTPSFLSRGLTPNRRPFSLETLAVLLAFFSLVFTLALPVSGQAAPPKRFEIQTFSLSTIDETLSINLALALDDEDGLYNILKDGAVVELGIDVDIQRKRDWWSNADIASLRYTSVIRHDPLTREFYLMMPGSEQPLKDRNLTRLLANSWQKISLSLIPLSLIELEGRNQTYVISCSIALNHIETPPWLAQNSVFWSAEIIPAVNISLEYVYQ